jgi:hypothetical protein
MYLGIALTHLGEVDAAEKELKEFVKREYDAEDHNYRKRYLAYKFLGKLALKKNDNQKGAEYFHTAFALGQLYDSKMKRSDIIPAGLSSIVNALPKAGAVANQPLLV